MARISQDNATSPPTLTACPGCDLLLPKITTIPFGTKTACPRCHAKLFSAKEDTVNRTLALAIAGLSLFIPGIFLPLMTFKTLGMTDSGSVLMSILTFYRQDYHFVATVVLISAVIFPLLKLSALAIITLCIRLGKYSKLLIYFFRLYIHMDEWGMVEVYLLGIMVTIIKMYHTVDIIYGPGFFSFIALVLLTMGSSVTLDKRTIWRSLENQRDMSLEKGDPGIEDQHRLLNKGLSALQAGFVLCRDCHKLLPAPPADIQKGSCPRCYATVHARKPHSISRTWALVISAAVLFFPANMLPIMRVDFLGIPDNSTILDGIQYFFKEGSYGIGLIILTASVLVPLFKIVGLLIILLTIRFKSSRSLTQKSVMFRFIEYIGRWSMLDIFVIALLGLLVNFGLFTSIQAAPAATYFCLVVVSTMFAAITFDPRLMWDACYRE